jgi:hypothetical protein
LAQAMGTNILKYVCLLSSAINIDAAVTAIQSVRIDHSRTLITHFDEHGKIYPIFGRVVFALGFYRIQIRLLITGSFSFAFGVVTTYHVAPVRDFPSFWLPIIMCIIGGAAVMVYCGSCSKRQNTTFVTD